MKKVRELMDNIFTRKHPAAWEKAHKVLADKRRRRMKEVSSTCKAEVGVNTSEAHRA